MPLKKIGSDEPHSGFSGYVTACWYMCAGNAYTEKIFKQAFLNCYPIKLYGSARNDILFRNDVDIAELKEKLKLPHDCRIALYAPTFRYDYENNITFSFDESDYGHLISALRKRFGGKWAVIFRAHDMVMNKINFTELAKRCGGGIINGNIGDDMAEYYMCSDVLITDYSSSMFDFSLTGKPCFLVTPDREYYENVERGFYMDFDALPFPSAMNFEALEETIKNFDADKYKIAVEEFLDEVGNVEDGHAAERVVNDIIAFLDKKK